MNSNKTISIITGNYYPEETAIGFYTTEFAKDLKCKGYNVNIITGFPYYPQWEISDDYKDKSLYYQEVIDDIKIYRYKIYVPKKVTFKGRIKMMMSFLKGTIININKIKNTDLVICIVPFTFSIIPAYLLAKKRKAKLWIHIQDFEFDLAFETGIFNNFLSNFLKIFIFKTERFLLSKANIISSISFNMIKKTKEKVKNKSKEVFYFPNWVSSQKINPAKFEHHTYFKKEKFSILYSGNIGQKQDWDIFIDLCYEIKMEDEIEIVIVGDGTFAKQLKKMTFDFKFIHFYEPVAFNELNNLLCSADLHFLFQKTDVLDSVMPSKILGMMASGRPSIITGNINSEVKKVFNEANCGHFLSQDDSLMLYKLILDLKNNNLLREKHGLNARKYVIEKFSEEVILNDFSDKINIVLTT
ncbi:WcaI family glycosyltransferase [Flavobacterium sp. HNIBRBA15423]|uniref:WcaI family glycosyltransferase n=1 Tax=Flavobacterium sp. HNIBRBA15423 TaxID=3458683 RepID=UPI004043F93A